MKDAAHPDSAEGGARACKLTPTEVSLVLSRRATVSFASSLVANQTVGSEVLAVHGESARARDSAGATKKLVGI